MNQRLSKQVAEYIREIVFGLEDSLASTLGALTGIAVGSKSTFIVILSGLVLIAAEGTSMAAGSYLSSKSAMETERNVHSGKAVKGSHNGSPVRSAIVMGVSYLFGGFIPLLPYALMDVSYAVVPSVILTAFSLFLVGVFASRFTKRSAMRSGFEMTFVSLTAALIGYLIGTAVSAYFGMTQNA